MNTVRQNGFGELVQGQLDQLSSRLAQDSTMTTEQQMRAVKLDGLVALVSRLPKRYTVYPNGDYSRYSATGMSNIDPRLGKLVGRNGNSISSYTTNRSLPVVIDTVQLPERFMSGAKPIFHTQNEGKKAFVRFSGGLAHM